MNPRVKQLTRTTDISRKTISLPKLGHEVRYKGDIILTSKEANETLGRGVKNLIGLFKGSNRDKYIEIIRSRNKNQLSNEINCDLPNIVMSKRRKISIDIRDLLRKRNGKKEVCILLF